MDRFDDAQEDPKPKEKGLIQRLSERFFPPAALGAELEKKLKKGRQTPPTGRRRPQSGAPIDKMTEGKKKAKGSEGYYDAAGTR